MKISGDSLNMCTWAESVEVFVISLEAFSWRRICEDMQENGFLQDGLGLPSALDNQGKKCETSSQGMKNKLSGQWHARLLVQVQNLEFSKKVPEGSIP
ncbi:uncharacterized protein [Henckelia pumila]|uniref:uncharacterized protein isoform X3 n=1 Tax=Henckelia pumila TaxID=405737 RepID=UPI003C6DDC70